LPPSRPAGACFSWPWCLDISTSSPHSSTRRVTSANRPSGPTRLTPFARASSTVGGGANVAQQYLEAGLLGELQIHPLSALLGRALTGADTPRRGMVQVSPLLEHPMSAGHAVTITPSDAHVEVRLDGELLATTDHALRLDETGLPSRYYLPQDDVRMDLLRPTSFHTTCPFKGEASYWSANVGGQTHDGIVWAYEAPIPAAAEIAGFLSFYPNRTEITVDGEVLTA
jgi:uncharacterized protein (DUF427 family)